MNRGLIASSFILLLPAGASAEIIPFWRVNPITPEAMAASVSRGAPLTPESRSVTLLITLTQGSRFAVAGIDLDGLLGNPNDIRYFQYLSNGINIGPPHTDEIEASPARLAGYDTWVGTAGSEWDRAAATPGRLNGTGASLQGTSSMVPTSGKYRIGRFFNVAWGATPANGEDDRTFEIANITFASGVTDGFTPIPLQFGQVRDSLNPNVAVALPPIPVRVPEPTSAVLIVTASLALRRRS